VVDNVILTWAYFETLKNLAIYLGAFSILFFAFKMGFYIGCCAMSGKMKSALKRQKKEFELSKFATNKDK